MARVPSEAMDVVRGPEDHDWSGQWCTFMGRVVDGVPLCDDAGVVLAGEVKFSAVVVDQVYLGRVGAGAIPDYRIRVKGESGKVFVVELLRNRFEPMG